MKLEKINENQIRCTLTREDLASRHIRLSELAYGSEKAKKLFPRNKYLKKCGKRSQMESTVTVPIPTPL